MLQNAVNHNDSLAIITVVYQNYSILQNYLDSLVKQKNKNFHIFITDLSDTKQIIKLTRESKQFTVINGNNKGYAHGVNTGLKQAISQGFTNLCIMNNDTYVENDFVDSVLQSISKNPSSIIGGKIYYAPGFEYHKTRYQKSDLGNVIWYAGGTVDWNHALTPHRGVDEVDVGKYKLFENTEFVNGCLMCFDKQVVDLVGYWDESYFLYYEDADFCERAKQKGVKLYYDPSIIVWHKNAQSTEGSGSQIHLKYQKVNRLKFGLKYAPFKTKLHLIKNYITGF